MSGWIVFVALALATLAGLRFAGRLRGEEALLALAAVFVAAAGYTWQGSPGLAGAPAQGRARAAMGADTLYMAERAKLLHVYRPAAQWLVLGDALNRNGDDLAAAQVLAGALRRAPDDATLRLGYAHALLVVADYHLTPAVELAFARAITAAPADPAVRYFAGLAHFEAGDVAGAATRWRALMATLPAESDWHAVLEQRLAFTAMLLGTPR